MLRVKRWCTLLYWIDQPLTTPANGLPQHRPLARHLRVRSRRAVPHPGARAQRRGARARVQLAGRAHGESALSVDGGARRGRRVPAAVCGNPEKWNDTWDAFFKRHRAFPNGPHDYLFQYALKVIQEIPRGLEGALAGYPGLVSGTCAIQRNITAEALDHFAHDAFEVKWMDAGSEVRGRYILGAMAGSKARNLNEARNYCPELSLRRLRLDGKLFLGLLNKPIFVPHAGWDAWAAAQSKLNDSEEEKIALAEIMILRTKLISANVQWRDHQAGVKARHSEHLARCSYMSCTKTEPPDGSVKFSRCKSCFEKMQRQVLYCSGACQKADWKLRHKAICGKPLDFETVSRAGGASPLGFHLRHRSFPPTPEVHKSKSSMFSSLQKVSKRNLRHLEVHPLPLLPAPVLAKGAGDGRGRTLHDALVLVPALGDMPSPLSPVLRKSSSSASLLLHERAVSGLTGHSGVSNLCTR
ncbi:hypothetical protein B0H14DRAFT_3616437 [Mycena olivaceomarginata]|nr:hypothetical protein B0H14DRAFT_3616437 [Mycena olivaceomarginata]